MELTKDDVIEMIQDEMVCANDCQMNNSGYYDIDSCSCYKADVLGTIKAWSV